MIGRDFLSARARAALARHQREVIVQLREMQSVDRVLNGVLAACDARSQRETVENYLESVQELRVSLQRLENFLLQKVSHPLDGNDAVDYPDPHTNGGLASELTD